MSVLVQAKQAKSPGAQTRTLSLPTFGIWVFGRLLLIAAVSWIVASLVPIAVWGFNVKREIQLQSQELAAQATKALNEEIDALACLASDAARHVSMLVGAGSPGKHGPVLGGSGSCPDGITLNIHWLTDAGEPERSALPACLGADAVSSHSHGIAELNGKTYLFASAPVLNRQRIPVAIVEVRRSLAAAEQLLGAQITPAGSQEFGEPTADTHPQANKAVFPKVIARIDVAGINGKRGLLIERKAPRLPMHPIAASGIIAAIGVVALVAMLMRAAARARAASSMMTRFASTLAAIAAGDFTASPPAPQCRESQLLCAQIEELRQQLQAQRQVLSDTLKLQSMLAHTYREESLAEAMWHYCQRRGVDVVEVIRIDASRAHARRVFRGANRGMDESERQLSVPEDCPAFRQAAPFRVEDTKSELTCKFCVGPKDRSYYCLPLLGRGTAVGILRLASRRSGFFDEQMKKLAKTYAGMLAGALDNTFLFNELRQATLRDPLTGLYNRRFLDEYIAKKQAELRRAPEPVGVIMLDIDHFKHFNDTYGHDAGDIALRIVGSIVQRLVREADAACRYGGEELLVVAGGTQVDEAAELAERLRKAVESEVIYLPRRTEPVHLTVSAGVAVYPDHARTIAEAVRAADEALYVAKAGGRNRVAVYTKPGAPRSAEKEQADAA
ncbi:MAG: sensor domain-containing diguanylate cyclase [Armatimonadetes bacterium]|nr:sensor domain-containing diguanylate cyclase [Armatimonadota bacterium]